MTSIIKQAAELAVRDTRCTFSVARELAVEAVEAAKADGIAFDVESLADVVGDMLEAEGWV